MNSTAPGYARALSRVWDGLRMTFLDWSHPPQPVVTWNLTPKRFPRVASWLRSDIFYWLFTIYVFGLGYAAGEGEWGTFSVIAGVLAALPMVLARYNVMVGWRAAVSVSLVAVVVQMLWPPLPSGIAALATVGLSLLTFLVAITHARPIGIWAWALTVPIVSVILGAQPGIVAILIGVAALIADALRSRRLDAQKLSDERERAASERARRVTVEERARIARELHDVVAHHMSIVAVRAETAPYRIGGLSEEAKSEFAEISTAARESLNEIRGLLTVLRHDESPRVPQPDLGQVDHLVEATRSAGANVDLNIMGRRRPLRSAVELSAYRILQESLANVTRHAPGETAEVWIDYSEDTLGLMVANPTTGPVGRPGHGITGMVERATAVGGTVDARRRADGRFVIEATLPVER